MIRAIRQFFSGNGFSDGSARPKAVGFEKLENRQFFSASPAVPDLSHYKLTNVFNNGINANQSIIRIPFTLAITIADASKIAVRGYVTNPITNVQKKVTIDTTDIHVDPVSANILEIHTDTLMRKDGGKIIIRLGALVDHHGARPLNEFNISSPKGQNKPRFTLARRAFLPTNHNLFSTDIYGDASAATPAATTPPVNTVTTNFTALMDRKVLLGNITQATRNTALARFNDATVKSIVPNANLRAAILSLYGTVGEPAIAAMLDGENTTGKHQTIIDFSTDVSPSAEVAETLVLSNGRLRTLFRTSYAGEPFQALSTWIAHEALHQDADAGQNEAIATNIVETIVWAQQILVSQTPITANTALVKSENEKLLAMLNSGQALFPRVGMYQATLHNSAQGVFPGSSIAGGAYTSYENFIRRIYIARGFGTNNSPGNATLDKMMKNITALNKSYSLFNTSEFTDFDANQQIITDQLAIKFAGFLKCDIA